MKLTIFLLLFSIVACAQSKVTDSKITAVTVFLEKAQVTRQVKAQVDNGSNEIVIGDLPAQIDPQSIQVNGKGRFIIQGVTFRNNYMGDEKCPTPILRVRDSLKMLNDKLAFENSRLDILTKEEQMILNNQKIGGANQTLEAEDLEAMSNFFRYRLTDLVTNKMKQGSKITKLKEHIANYNKQLKEVMQKYGANTGEIVVSYSSSSQGPADLELSYVVSGANWYPVYDLRAANTRAPIQLNYKAAVTQSTGEDWKNVMLTLSTANPGQGGKKPEITPWYLRFYQPQPLNSNKRKRALEEMSKITMEAPAREYAPEPMSNAETTSNYFETVQTSVNTEFALSIPHTILSSNKAETIDVRKDDLAASYRYFTAPKLDGDAFLVAQSREWEQLSLLPGEANIFFEGTFVAKTFIDPNHLGDTLTTSLGRDKRIVVKREKMKEYSRRQFMGGNKRDQFAWEISIRNTKTEPIDITVEDQIPLSQDSQIEVMVEDTNGAGYNKTTGKLVWELSLKPNETRKVNFKYTVKYPKDKQVQGL